MRDKKDNATFELPGFGPANAPDFVPPAEVKRASASRQRKPLLKQQQLELLEETDVTGLPVWRRDENTDLTGLPNWAAA